VNSSRTLEAAPRKGIMASTGDVGEDALGSSDATGLRMGGAYSTESEKIHLRFHRNKKKGGADSFCPARGSRPEKLSGQRSKKFTLIHTHFSTHYSPSSPIFYLFH